jgi:lycopene beta-cyclase
MPHQYDYIIAGAGAAGLSLLTRMVASGKFSDKKILLVDKTRKDRNDRTWCFWEKREGFFEEIVYRKWNAISFKSPQYHALLDAGGYSYKMIRGIDFYKHCFEKISLAGNIDIRYGELSFVAENNNTRVYLNGGELDLGKAIVFNSIPQNTESKSNTIHLLQHFKGWFIGTEADFFNEEEATLMDFRIDQLHGTSFVYVLPLSKTRALVEYTLFTGELLEPHEYDEQLRNYIGRFLQLRSYNILEEEFGIIPMTNARFSFYQNGIYNIGTAGGQTKASTGYTFQFIQKQSEEIVNFLMKGGALHELPPAPARFRFYDSVLLQLLEEGKLEGREIFSRLFSRNKASAIFKFLDNETTLREELRLISSLQIAPFFKAALKQLY